MTNQAKRRHLQRRPRVVQVTLPEPSDETPDDVGDLLIVGAFVVGMYAVTVFLIWWVGTHHG